MNEEPLSSSFRDPSGWVYKKENKVFRRVNSNYFTHFDHLHSSGLYEKLIEKNLLIKHDVIARNDEYLILLPEQLEFVSYPYEWSFSHLKEAAIKTLRIQLDAIECGMTLKDASAYNLQYYKGKMVFIDTLSFEVREQNQPWIAYRQFCQHFLCPLLLMRYISLDFNKALSTSLDGFSLAMTSKILPFKAKLSPTVFSNVVLHSYMDKDTSNANTIEKLNKATISDQALKSLLTNLKSFISGLKPKRHATEWDDYYSIKNYSSDSFEAKGAKILEWVKTYQLKSIWDLGGNNGHFTDLVSPYSDFSICSDIDPNAIEVCAKNLKACRNENTFPLVADFTNPAPGCGAMGLERESFFSRIVGKEIQCIFALAVIHHLTITHNQTFDMVARQLGSMGDYLIIEFVSRSDSWVSSMLSRKLTSVHLYDFYNQDEFETRFKNYFEILEIENIANSHRVLYLMKSKARNRSE